jgi:hypothetical protein
MVEITAVEIQRERRLQQQRVKLLELFGSNPKQKSNKEKSPRKRTTGKRNVQGSSSIGVKRTDLRSERKKIEGKKWFDISLLGDVTRLTQWSQFVLFKNFFIPCPKCNRAIQSNHKAHWKRCVGTSLSSLRRKTA